MTEKPLYEWDSKLTLGDEDFLEHLTTDEYDPNAASEMAFPSDYTLAMFSDLAYNDTHFELPQDWQLLTTATNDEKRNGYFGVAFWNSKLCQIVISHRGTMMNFGAMWTDVQLAFSKEETKQSYSAATFVHMIGEEIKAKMREGGPRFQLTITGHSLGAWLAQITTFTLQYFRVITVEGTKVFVEDRNYMENIHAHTVVFESPGCKTALDKLGKKVVPHRYSTRQYGNYNTLDMTVYLSQPNFINVVHEHVGIIFIVESSTHRLKGTIDLFDPETHEIKRELVLDFPHGKYDSFMLLSPFYHKTAENYITEPSKEYQYSLKVFSDNELDFIKDWIHMIHDPSPSEEEFNSIQALKDEYLIPEFRVDYDSNLIKSNDLDKTIARIKNLRPTKKIIFEKLNVSVKERVQYEIFKKETAEIQKKLLNFHNYYFKDSYNYSVKRFLNSENNKVLRIHVDAEHKYKLELSVLNNIITFYKKFEHSLLENYFNTGQYGFLTWNKLRETLKHCPNIFHNYKVKLLVVEYFEADHNDIEAVLSFLNSGTVKVIIVSMGLFSALEETVQVEGVSGLASNLRFEDLKEDSQALIKQTKLILHGQERNLVDVFLDNTLLNNEVLLEIITNPTNEIFIDSQYNKLVHAANFLDMHSEIKQIKYDKDVLYVIQNEENYKLTDKIKDIFGVTNKENIKIENKVDFERLCKDLHKPAYLFTFRNGQLFLTKIFNLNFYIHRSIRHVKSVNADSFKNLTKISNSDKYYFCGDKTKFTEKLRSLTEEERDRFRFINSEEEAKRKINTADSHAHLLKIENESIFWLQTKGNIRSLRKCVKVDDTCIDEEQLTKDDIVIVSGEPGIGKSSMIGYLQLYLQRKYWSFTISLKNCIFDKLPEKINLEHAFKFILENVDISKTTFTGHLLLNCLQNTTHLPIYLMLDEYDEIPKESARKKFINLVNVLKRESKAKILITTRKYRCEELEDGISVFGSFFEVADGETNAKKFLSTVWRSQLNLHMAVVESTQLEQSVTKLLNGIRRRLENHFFSFIDIPLNIRMLAEVVGSITTVNDIPTDTHIPNILSLYQKYTETHCNIFFRRSELSGHKSVLKMWMLKSIFEGLRYLAVRRLFNMCLEIVEYEELEELNKVGLIQSEQTNNNLNLERFEFLHDSVGDYFVGNSLRLWLDSFVENSHKDWDIANFMVSDFLINKKFKEMRLFLNCQLEEFTIATDRLEMCRNKFRELWESDKSIFFDNQESIFHVCVRENLCALIKYFIFKVIDKTASTELLSSRNSNLETPFFLILPDADPPKDNAVVLQEGFETCLNIFLQEFDQWQDDIKMVLLATLFTCHVTMSDIKRLVKYSKDYKNITRLLLRLEKQFKEIDIYLNEACSSENTEKLNSILLKFQDDETAKYYLLRTTNKDRETGLHICNNKQVLNQLLELGLNMDLQDHHGMTPLARAIKQNKKEVANELIEKGAARTPDTFGNTPLIHAVKQDNFDLVKALLQKKNLPINAAHQFAAVTTRRLTENDLDQRLTKSCLDLPSIVPKFDINLYEISKKNYLEQSNVCKLTPLMFAVRVGNIKMVKYLVNQGANINAVDYNGMTSVHHEVIAGPAKKMMRNLKKLGANMNIPDQNGVTPLLYAVKKRKWNKVRSLLDNDADINIGSTDAILTMVERSNFNKTIQNAEIE